MPNDYLTFARRMEMLRLIPEKPSDPISTTLLHKKLERDYRCTKRTVERDLESLSVAYQLYTETNGRSNSWGFVAGGKQLLHRSNSAAALSFILAEPYLKQVLPGHAFRQIKPQFEEAKSSLKKFSGTMSVWPDRIRVLPETKQLLPPEQCEATWEIITEALLQNKQLAVSYASRSHQDTKQLNLTPLALVAKGATHYLVATANDYTTPYIYALHRIADVRLTDALCPDNSNFDIDDFLRNFGWGHSGDIELIADISESIASRLQETPISHQQEIHGPADNGRYRLTAIVPDDQETRWWVYGLNEHIRVEAPEHWVEEFASKAKTMAKLYGVISDDSEAAGSQSDTNADSLIE